MKILYIALSCGPNLGSEDAVGWNIPLEAARLGHDVTVLTRSDKRSEIESYIAANPNDTYPSFIYQKLSLFAKFCKGPFYSVRAQLWCSDVSKELRRLCARGRYDVVHQITPVEFRAVVDMTGVEAFKVVGPMGGGGDIAPIFVKTYLQPKERFIEWVRGLMNRSSMRCEGARNALCSHDVVLAANDETARAMRSMGWRHDIPIQSEVAVRRVAADSSTAHGGLVVGAAGRLHYGKGYLFLLDVLARIKDANVRLRIAGDGPQRRRIEERIRELGLEDKVELLGGVSYHRMEDFYHGIDVFAFPSFREATGTVLVEAMAAGVPVVAFDIFGAHGVLRGRPQSLVLVGDDLSKTIAGFSDALLHTKDLLVPSTCDMPQTWKRHTEALVKLYGNKGSVC